ncbi:CBS domain-containing protein [candidate division WWE3 bacterium]|uniref:CBS domain-containing protein n=1 Tax=candidate division WWE3 bacterium TaxID=2053526 RepID=A0A955RNZ6_UNCKA|nr:CBS domain-containing protein [candidate division WWE3 bacterium]
MLISEIYHHEPWTIRSDATIKEGIQELIKDGCNGLIVVDENDKLKGVLALQDIAAATIPHEFRNNLNLAAAMFKRGFFQEMCATIKDQPVSSVMRTDFVDVTLDTNIMAVTADFLENDLYLVPVVDKGELIGVVSRTDIKKALALCMGVPDAE